MFEHVPGLIGAMRSFLKHVGAVARLGATNAILPIAILARTFGATWAAGGEIAPCFAAGEFFISEARASAADGVAGRGVEFGSVGHPLECVCFSSVFSKKQIFFSFFFSGRDRIRGDIGWVGCAGYVWRESNTNTSGGIRSQKGSHF